MKFAKTGVTMAANQYKRYNVTYDDKEGTGVTTRPIEVGDYYYADGNIVPKDFTKIPEGCIGVVFSTSTMVSWREMVLLLVVMVMCCL